MNQSTGAAAPLWPAGLTGLEQLRALIAGGRRPPMAETLNFNLIEVEAGRALFEGAPGLGTYNPMRLRPTRRWS